MTKTEQFTTGLQIIAPKILRANFRDESGMAMFRVEPLTDDEIRRLEELTWSAGENRAAFDGGGAWK